MAAPISHWLRRIGAVSRRYLTEVALAISAEVIASATHLSVVLHVVVSAAALIAGSRLRRRRP